MSLIKRWLCFGVVVLLARSSWALTVDEDSDESGGRERPTMIDKAKHRIYAGGRDEQDLKIISVLIVPTRSPGGSVELGEGNVSPAGTPD